MTIRFSTGLRNTLLADTADGGKGFAQIFLLSSMYLYSGAQPVNADANATGTLLAKVTTDGLDYSPGSPTNGLNWGTPSGGILNKDPGETWRYTGIAAGTIGWFRLIAAGEPGGVSLSAPRVDGSVATVGANLNLSNLVIAIGTPGIIVEAPITFPPQMIA